MSEPFMGEIKAVGFNYAPRSWAMCGGAIINISQNQALFTLLGATYGGDGRTSFGLPDLRGRVAVGFGNGPGLSQCYRQGLKAGAEVISLSENELPKHTHTATVSRSGGSAAQVLATTEKGDSATPTVGAYLAQTVAGPKAVDVPEKIYKTTPSAGSSVALGGVSAGDVSVTVSNANTGSGDPYSNMQPFLAINYIIALQGIYPSRN